MKRNTLTPTTLPDGPIFLSVDEAAALARVSRRTLYQWLTDRTVSFTRVGRVTRIERGQFLRELNYFTRLAVR